MAAIVPAATLLIAGCSLSHQPAPQCPHVVTYTNAQLDAIQRSINRLPPNDPLRGVLHDYENLQDDARVCAALEKGE
jgi:hypothetical protein